jgi:IS4 transposase
MAVIPNKWVEKEKKKRVHETAPAFETDSTDTWQTSKTEKSKARHSPASVATMRKTLRGIRR